MNLMAHSASQRGGSGSIPGQLM